jgi:non-specific serine/threonine protein kinase
MTVTASSLPVSTRLEEFELTGLLGEGGFSVVYTALDHSLERIVAIKEYMPSAIATRLPDGSVSPKSLRHEETFRAGLESFINEARLLAKFTHPALVHIHRVWEQNGTAYMAMQYCIGNTLRKISQLEPSLVKDEGWLKRMFAAILDALDVLHAQNCFHRDISPDNILILQSGEPILLDFGAARQIIGDMTQALTVILKPGFAPIEQYADDSSLQQGPWTDVYGVGAVLYYLLLGKPPVASVARLVKDPIIKLADYNKINNISHSFREGIDHALAVYPVQRIQSIASLREELHLPTFKFDEQTGRLFGTSAGSTGVISGELSAQDGVNAGFKTTPDSNLSSLAATTKIASSSDSGKSANIIKSSNMAKIKVHRQPTILGNVAAGIGVIIIILIAAFIFLHKPHNMDIKTKQISSNSIPASKRHEASSATDAALNLPSSQPTDSHMDTMAAVPTITINPPPVSQGTEGSKNIIIDNNPKQASAPSISANKENLEQSSPPSRVKTIANTNDNDKIAMSSPATPFDHAAQSKIAVSNLQTGAIPVKTDKKMETQPEATVPTATNAQANTASSFVHGASIVRLSIRPWGQIIVDGQSRGISPPLSRLSLTPGNHEVNIKNGDFSPVTIQIAVPEKGEIVVSHHFENK